MYTAVRKVTSGVVLQDRAATGLIHSPYLSIRKVSRMYLPGLVGSCAWLWGLDVYEVTAEFRVSEKVAGTLQRRRDVMVVGPVVAPGNPRS